MNQLEDNILISFRKVRNDLDGIRSQLAEIRQQQEDMLQTISKKEKRPIVNVINKKEKAVAGKKSKNKGYVAAKDGKKFHILACPFAKNIHPKSKVIFKTKDSALNKGYKPCKCVQK